MTKVLNRFITLTEEQTTGINMKIQEVQSELNIPAAGSQTVAMRVLLSAQRLSEFLSLQESLIAEDLDKDFSQAFASQIQQAFGLASAIATNFAGIVCLSQVSLKEEPADRLITAISGMFADLRDNPNRSHREILQTVTPFLLTMYHESIDARFVFSALAERRDMPPTATLVDTMFANLALVEKVSQTRVDTNAYIHHDVADLVCGSYNRRLADAYTQLVTAARVVLITSSSPLLRIALSREPEVALEEFNKSLELVLNNKILSIDDVNTITAQITGMESVVKDHLSKIQTVMTDGPVREEKSCLENEAENIRKKAESMKNTVTDTVKKYSPSARTWKWIGAGAAAVGVGAAGAYFYKKYGRKVRTVTTEELENNPSLEVVVTAPAAE